MSGVPRQPAEVAKQKGVYRPSRHGDLKSKIDVGFLTKVPEPPELLNEHGAKFWYDMLNNLLEVKGLISFVDLPTFQIMATKYQTIIECNELLKIQSKWIVDVTGNIKENPVCVTLEKAEKIFLQIATQFGCNPSARNTLRAAPQKEEEKDPLSEFSL